MARDTLGLMRAGYLQAHSIYGQFVGAVTAPADTLVCDLLKKTPCEVCGKAALFMGFAKRQKLRLRDLQLSRYVPGPVEKRSIHYIGADGYGPLRRLFGKNFNTVERYYEVGAGLVQWPGRLSNFDFQDRYPDDDQRLRVILRNIARNGKFVPPRVRV